MHNRVCCVYKVVKARNKFAEFIHDHAPATVDVNALLDRLTVETIDVNDIDEEMFYLEILSDMLYSFFLEGFENLQEFIYINESECYYYFPVGYAFREVFLYFNFETEKNVRMLKLKYPKLMRELEL